MDSRFTLSRHPGQDHLSLAPPRDGRWLGPLGLALLAHGLLVAALTWGVGWKQDAVTPAFEAELWSRLPVQAAPRAVAPPPPAEPAPPPKPTPQPEPRPAPPPPPPGPSEAEIATRKAEQKAREQQATEAERKKALAEKAAAEKAEAAKKREAEKKAAEKLAAEKKAAAERKLAEKKAADEKRAEAEAEKLRQENLRRMLGQAGASGGPQASGTAQKSSGPSAGYGAKVAARIKPNVVFTDAVSGNPRTVVEVRTLPDGTIAGRRIVQKSGNPDWDEAVLKAIDRTGSLPRDTDGRVPASLEIGLRPLD